MKVMKYNFLLSKFFRFSLVFILITTWLFSGFPRIWQKPPIPPKIQEALAANYLTNPSFTGETTGWTLTTTVYDSSYYQDTAGSVKTATAAGKNTAGTGSAEQTISTNIVAGSTVKLSHYWSKQCVAVNCALNTIQVDIAKPSAPTTWVTIWSNTSIPAYGSATAWTGPSNLDVSSNFNETGQYKIRLYANLKNGNNTSAQSLAWFDNINLDVTPPPGLTWATGEADFKIYQSSSLTWGAGTLICSGTLTDNNASTITCSPGSIANSTQYRIDVLLKNVGGGAANMQGASEYVDHKYVKTYWAGTSPTLGSCGFYDAGPDDGATTCSVAWNATNDVRITNTGAGNVVIGATSGTEGFMYLITTGSDVPSSNSSSYMDASIDSVTEDSSKITIKGPLSTAIAIRARDYTTSVSNITFPEAAPGSTVSQPYNNINGSGNPQTFGGAGVAKPVVTLYNSGAGSLIIWYNITTFANSVVSNEYYLINTKGAACANADAITNAVTFGADTSTGTTIAAGAGNEKDLYLKVILSAVAGKIGTSTLTILGEAL